MAGSSIDHRIFEAARLHGGAVARAQLQVLSISTTSIDRRVRSGLLVAVLAGFYVVPAVAAPEGAAQAVLLAFPEAALACWTAGGRHGFALPGNGLHVVVGHRANVRARGVVVHQTRHLPAIDVVSVDGLRVTAPARTICDLAPFLSDRRLVHLVEAQLSRHQPTTDELVGCYETRRRRSVAGMARLGRLLAELIDDEPVPESKLEAELFRGLARIGLTGIRRQFRPPWYDGIRGVVDGADPVGRTIIEADGRRYGQVTQAHDDDRRRDRLAAVNGSLTVRVGWRELRRDPDGVLGEVADIVLGRRGAAIAQQAAA